MRQADANRCSHTSLHLYIYNYHATRSSSMPSRRVWCPQLGCVLLTEHGGFNVQRADDAHGFVIHRHPQHSNGNSHIALGDRRSETTTAGSALGCARGRHPRLGLAVRYGGPALKREKKYAFFVRFFHVKQAKKISKMTPFFSLIPKVLGHV